MSDETEIYCETPSGGRYRLNLVFPEGRGSVESMPRCPGVYAEIHRPTNYIRIGSAQEMRGRNKQHIAWAEKHKNGTHTKQSEVNRKGPIVDVAKEHGASGLEYYVVCSDPGMADMAERQAVENFMHDWCRRQTKYLDMNGEAKHKHLRV